MGEFYPDKVKKYLVHWVERGYGYEEAVEKTIKQFPEYKGRLTVQRAYPMVRYYQKMRDKNKQEKSKSKKSGKKKTPKKKGGRAPWKTMSKDSRDTILESARLLHAQGMNWKPIAEALGKKFKNSTIPTPHNLARMSTGKPARNGSRGFTMTIASDDDEVKFHVRLKDATARKIIADYVR